MKLESVTPYFGRASQGKLFDDLRVLPNPFSLIGVGDSSIVAAAHKKGLAVNEQFLPGYIHNLIGLLPYYRQILSQIIKQLKCGEIIVCLGRDFDLPYSGLIASLAGTSLTNRVVYLPLSGSLRDKLPPDSAQAQRFLNQYIDFNAVAKGERHYSMVDTGFMGTTFDWINSVYQHTHKHKTNRNIRPITGVFIRTQGRPEGMFSTKFLKPQYPQFKIKSQKYKPKDFICPDSISDMTDLNYAVAALTQLMPKHFDHVDSLVRSKGGTVPVASESRKEIFHLGPVESIPLKDYGGGGFFGGRKDWVASIDPVAATRLQAFVVNYFAVTNNKVIEGHQQGLAALALNEFYSHFPSLFENNLSPIARRFRIARESGYDHSINGLDLQGAIPDISKVFNEAKEVRSESAWRLPRMRTLSDFIALNRAPTTLRAISSRRGDISTAVGCFLYRCWGSLFAEYSSVSSVLQSRIDQYKNRENEFPKSDQALMKSDLAAMRRTLLNHKKMSLYDFYLKRKEDPLFALRLVAWPVTPAALSRQSQRSFQRHE